MPSPFLQRKAIMKNPKIGSCVILHIDGHQIPAIVINIFPTTSGPPMVSVAHADYEEKGEDVYGRKIIYTTSVNHAEDKVGGSCWSDIIITDHENSLMALDPYMVESAEPYQGP